jgi:hypothetical protein
LCGILEFEENEKKRRKKEEERQTKNIWFAHKKNTLNAPFRKYVETI